MSTHNICFHGEIRKIFTGYPPISIPMFTVFMKKLCIQVTIQNVPSEEAGQTV